MTGFNEKREGAPRHPPAFQISPHQFRISSVSAPHQLPSAPISSHQFPISSHDFLAKQRAI